MKIIKRVSLLQSIKRIGEPPPAAPFVTRLSWNWKKPYRFTRLQELYRFGYHNRPNKIWLLLGVIFAFSFGTMVESAEKCLMDVHNLVIRMKIKLSIAIDSEKECIQEFGCN